MINESKTSPNLPFTIHMPVRITDINYGMHLGHMAVVGIFHNARVLFLNSHGFKEMDIEGVGLILLNSHYFFKNEASFNDNLLVSVGIGEFSKLKLNFIYKAVNQKTGLEVVSGHEEIACFDYTKRKISRIPSSFLEFCKKNKNNQSEQIS